MCCWYFTDAWLEDPPSPKPTPPPPPQEKIGYEYVSIPCACGCKPPTAVQHRPNLIALLPPAAMSTKDEYYEHWPDNAKMQTVSAMPAPRYDNHNGLYEHVYRPADEVKDAAPQAPKQDPAPAQQQYVQYPQMPYGGGQVPWMPSPAPAYYGHGGQPLAPPTYANYTTAAPPEANLEKAKPKAPSPRKWQGRTTAEVEEDDMKLAASQGAYAPRKVQPLNLADDQVVWVVEGDGKHLLRSVAEVRETKGEWKADPRFKDSWYFVREAGAEEGKK